MRHPSPRVASGKSERERPSAQPGAQTCPGRSTRPETPTVVVDLDGLSVRAQLAPAPTVEAAVRLRSARMPRRRSSAPMPGSRPARPRRGRRRRRNRSGAGRARGDEDGERGHRAGRRNRCPCERSRMASRSQRGDILVELRLTHALPDARPHLRGRAARRPSERSDGRSRPRPSSSTSGCLPRPV